MQAGPTVVKLNVWDTPGAERFRGVVSCYYRKASGVGFVYSITDRSSFAGVGEWVGKVREVRQEAAEVLIGNKADLAGQREVSYCEGAQLAERLGVPFLEASAKTSSNVEQVFATVLALVGQKGQFPLRPGLQRLPD